MIYTWRSGARWRIDANVAGEEIARIGKERAGRIKAEDIVESARAEKSPLHELFDWDDKMAGGKWRIHCARNMINHLMIVREEKEEVRTIRAFVVIDEKQNDNEAPDRAYEPIIVVLSDREKRLQFVERAMEELQSWRNRYDNIVEFASIYAEIDKARDEARKRRDDEARRRGRKEGDRPVAPLG